MKKLLPLFIIALLATACAHVPFQDTTLVSYKTRDPQQLVEHFKSRLPMSFQLLSTVVFEYNAQQFPGIGSMEINAKERTFSLACLNPMGVKIFDLAGDDQRITNRYTIAALAKYGNIAAVVGEDVKRIYFDLVPSAGASVWKRSKQFVYRQSFGSGYLEYVFGGEQGDLIEKRYYDDHVIAWSVSYYEYRDQNGKRYPQGVIFINYQHGYRLTVRHKELHF